MKRPLRFSNIYRNLGYAFLTSFHLSNDSLTQLWRKYPYIESCLFNYLRGDTYYLSFDIKGLHESKD